MVEDYSNELTGEEEIEGRSSYNIIMIPKPDGAVEIGTLHSFSRVSAILKKVILNHLIVLGIRY